jgi:hypothetical protein
LYRRVSRVAEYSILRRGECPLRVKSIHIGPAQDMSASPLKADMEAGFRNVCGVSMEIFRPGTQWRFSAMHP